ncbi:hypothetical protein Vadar_029604 [Vaccinium darrowii]|uniref:Uncharacterized protein n=1 Tax=Vaccinium darrowii TaxID=229202 RepID=A0ACB7Y9I4_9ERIC|nr:hypothetical protein Vadar_029604 [Vaccinium darrowii]
MPMTTSNWKSSQLIHYTIFQQRLSKTIQVHSLYRKRRRMKREMEMKNLKLLMENRSIIEENERLRKKAIQLQQENKALISQLQKKFSHQNNTIC